MRITQEDRMFWLHKKLPRALRDSKDRSYRGIDAVINGHVEPKERVNTDLHNAVSLLSYAGRDDNPTRVEFMIKIMCNNHPTSAGRIRYYKRWLRRYWRSIDRRKSLMRQERKELTL